MHRVAATAALPRFPQSSSRNWLARRWYYAARSRRSYSVRQISTGDRRLLAEFTLTLDVEGDHDVQRSLASILFNHVIASGSHAIGFAALATTGAGDRVIGVAAYAQINGESADFTVAVADAYREEQIGRTLLSTLLQQARRVGVRKLQCETFWSNRPAQMLARSIGFSIEPAPGDRSRRRLTLELK